MVDSINLYNPYNFNALDRMCVSPYMNFNPASSVNFGSMNSIFPASNNNYNNMLSMETSLYGGGTYNAPSFYNGYTSYPQMSMPTYNNPFTYQNTIATNPVTTTGSTVSTKANQQLEAKRKAAANTISEVYSNTLTPSESFGSAVLLGGLLFGGAMTNPRLLAHPFRSIAGSVKAQDTFGAGWKKDPDIVKLWKQNHTVMEDAYFMMNKLEARSIDRIKIGKFSIPYLKIGMLRKKYSQAEYDALKKIMQDAIQNAKATCNVDEVAKASAKLKAAYVNNGWLCKFGNKIGNIFRTNKKPIADVNTALSDITNTSSKAGKKYNTHLEEIKLASAKPTFKNILKRCGGKWALASIALELLMGIEKIRTAGKSSKKEGWQQFGQTAAVATANGVGWLAGEMAGRWAFAKLGATIGTCLGPGIGTAIGGIVGFLGGTIAMHFAGKGMRKLVGKDKADNITAQQMSTNAAGLQEMCEAIASDKKLLKKMSPEERATILSAMQTVGYNPQQAQGMLA